MCKLKVRLEIVGEDLVFQVLEMDEKLRNNEETAMRIVVGSYRFFVHSAHSPAIMRYDDDGVDVVDICLRGSFESADNDVSLMFWESEELQRTKVLIVTAFTLFAEHLGCKLTYDLILRSSKCIITIR